MIAAVATAVATFLVMELVSYASHRWLMHGPGMGWHRSHHAPPAGRFERNDRFPVVFSVVGVGLFLGASLGVGWLWPIALGVSAYGVAYLFVHEVHIHRRLPVPAFGGRYLRWLRTSHADHHRTGAEPYGMLLPLGRRRASSDDADRVLGRSVRSRPAGSEPPLRRVR